MAEFALIYRNHLKTIGRTLSHLGVLRTLSFILVIGVFFGGSFYVLYRIFTYLAAVELIGLSLIDRTVEMAFFVFFIMLLFSNIITSFSTFFNSDELGLLFSLPVRPTTIYLAKLFENSLYASWATMVVALPLVIAYGVTFRVPPLFYCLSLTGIAVYLVLPAALASAVIFILLGFFPRLRPRDVIIVSLGFIIGLSLLYLKISNPALLKIFETENEQDLIRFAANLSTVGGAYVPSTWLAGILKGTRPGQAGGFFYAMLLAFVSLSSVIAAYVVARFFYRRSWLHLGEHGRRANRFRSLLSRPAGGVARSLLFKDILLFVREPSQWVQLSIFLILLLIYIFSIRRTPLYFSFPQWRTLVSFANFAYICFVLATLGVRFIFPAISLEQKGLWFIGASPLSLRRVVMIKYGFNLVIVLLVFEGLLVLSNFMIRTDPRFYAVMPVLGLGFAAALVAIDLGLGSAFPQFNEDNPSRIAAGSGGIITALVSIGYVILCLVILAVPAYDYLASRYLHRPGHVLPVALYLGLFAAVSGLAFYLPLRLGTRALLRRDL